MFANKKIIVAVCGGIAAYKVCELVRELIRLHADVRVIMTPHASEFITPLTLQTLSGHPVDTDQFASAQGDIPHIHLARWPDATIVVPATATTMAKLAHGFADNLVTATILATKSPVVIAPAMNTGMWENPATIENLAVLHRRHFQIVEPEYGELASKSEVTGMGRLATTERLIFGVLRAVTQPKTLDRVAVLVTAGRTEEQLDPVRILTNHATGRMGFAIAEMAVAMGANVTLISGPTNLVPPDDAQYFPIVTALQMQQQVEAHYPENGVVVMAAAVSDFRPAQPSVAKIKKQNASPVVELVANPDILLALAAHKKKAIHVGFALETENELTNARDKLQRKKLDFIVVNNPQQKGAGFGTATNKVKIIFADGREDDLPLQDKRLVAREILDRVVEIRKLTA